MIKEKLTKEDKSILKSGLLQAVIPYIIVEIFLGFLFFILFHHYGLNIFLLLLLSASLIIYLILFIRSVKNPLFDVIKNEKVVKYEIVKGKRENKKYSYHMNTVADLKTQPVLIEYYLETADSELQVEKDIYGEFNTGDQIRLSITMFTNKVFRIDKS